MDYYVVKKYREFSNEIGPVEGPFSKGEALSTCRRWGKGEGKIVDEEYLNELQKRVHFSEGCTSENCRASETYDEQEEIDRGYNPCDFELMTPEELVRA